MSLNNIPALAILLLVSPPLLAQPTAEALPAQSSPVLLSLILGVAIIVVGALLVASLTLSSRKEEKIGSMMYFCIDFLINTRNKTERDRAAKLLSLIHISEPTRRATISRMPSSA